VAKPQPTPWVPIDRAPDLARDALQSAAKTLAAGCPRDALRACGWAWSHQRYLREAYELASRAAREVGESELARALSTIVGEPGAAGAWLQAGWVLVDRGASDLAVPLLEEAFRLEPRNPEIRESLVIAYSDEGRHDDVVALAQTMSLNERPSLAFPLTWSALMTRRTETVERSLPMLTKVAQKTSEVRGVHAKAAAAFERYRAFPPVDDIRHWHYVQYGGITLDMNEDLDLAGGRYNLLSLSTADVANLLRRLVHVGRALSVPFGPFGWVSRDGEILARALALMTGGGISNGGAPEAWLVLGDPRELDPPRYPRASDPRIRTFALTFPWTVWGPRVMDVTGVWAELAVLPWNGGWQGQAGTGGVKEVPADRRPAGEIAAEIVRAAEATSARGAADLSEFAIPRRALLSLVERRAPRGLPYVPDAPLPAASLNGMLG
jgi:hypothetical protein